MASTTNFNWSTPDDTSLVKDGAAAIRTLGQSIDTSMAELKGGTTGQVLSKTSNTDMDFTWVAQDDSNAIQNAIVDAKGDLIAATANDTPARLAVGTNGQVLTADSATATGLKWATPASGSTFSGVLLDNNATQSIANNTATAITWSLETYDTDAFHSTSSNTSRITIPAGKAGYYMVGGQLPSTSNATSFRIVTIRKNGTDFKRMVWTPNAIEPSVTISVPMSLAVGDYVELFYTQNSGGSISPYTGGTDGAFYAYYLGA